MKHLLVIYLLTAVSAFSADLWFSGMENGDRVEITQRSVGCFHDATSYYEVRKSDDACFFTQYAIAWDKQTYGKIAEKKIIVDLSLTQTDVKGLDGLLRFYRGAKTVASEGRVYLLVEYYEGSKRIKVENLEDISAGVGLREMAGVISLDDLSERARK